MTVKPVAEVQQSGTAAQPSAGLVPPAYLVRLLVVLAGLTLLIVLAGAIHLMRGAPNVSLGEVLQVLSGTASLEDDRAAFLIRELRLPRVLLALMCGAALALAGAIMQGALRNPIADPGLLGISQSASLVVAVQLFFPALIPPVGLPVACFVAGLASGSLLVLLARSVRDPVRVTLIGVVLAMFLGMLTAVVLLLAPEGSSLGTFYTFTTGSVSSASWDRFGIAWPWLAFAVPLALLSGRTINLLQLGDDLAAGLGMNVTRSRFLLIIVAMLLVAPVVAVAGPISFVALLSPHVARFLLRTSNAYLILPVSAVVGALVVLVADAIGKLLFFPLEIPVGIWTIAIIGPATVWLAGTQLRRSPRPDSESA